MDLPSTPYFLCFHYFGLAVAHSHFSTSYTVHGLLFLSFRAPLSPFTSSRPICLSHGPVIHYSCCLGLMGFLSICQLFSVRVARPLPSTWASEMAINNCYDFKIYFMQHSWNQTNKIVVLPLWCDMVMVCNGMQLRCMRSAMRCEVKWELQNEAFTPTNYLQCTAWIIFSILYHLQYHQIVFHLSCKIFIGLRFFILGKNATNQLISPRLPKLFRIQ